MAENRYMDDFMEGLAPGKEILNESDEISMSKKDGSSDFVYMDDLMKQKILKKTCRKIRRKKALIQYLAAACIILAVLSSFIPNTPAYAFRQAILSYIPGIGVVQTTDESDTVTSVLAEPVKVTDGEKFIEIRSAFIRGNVLTISGITNVGAVDAKNFNTVKEFKEFYSGETAPDIYLVQNNEKTKAGHRVWAGPSYETKTYRTDAYFYVDQDKLKNTFLFEMDGFAKPIQIALSQVKAGVMPEEIGNAAVIDDVMIFAHTMREKDILEVLVSIVAPGEFKNPRSYLFDDEKDLFSSGIYLTDQSGTRYEPDENLRKSRDEEIYAFYFHVPQGREGLKLVVPQILFEREYKGNNVRINMPKENKGTHINKKIQLGSHSILLDHASMVPAGSGILPDDFKSFGGLMINAIITTEMNSRESILRILPDILLPEPIFGITQVSQSIYADYWNSEQHNGYSLVSFDNMQETKKIILNFTAEISLAGPWEIELEKD